MGILMIIVSVILGALLIFIIGAIVGGWIMYNRQG